MHYAAVNSSCAQQPPPTPPQPPTPHPPTPQATAERAVARFVSPGDVVFANFALPGGRAFVNPGASPELLTRTQFPIRV